MNFERVGWFLHVRLSSYGDQVIILEPGPGTLWEVVLFMACACLLAAFIVYYS